MAYYEHKDGSGSLFKNDKGDNPKRPDYRGEIMLDGTLYELAGWKKDGKNGTFLSLSGKVKEFTPKPTSEEIPFDDSIPF